jgi:hypothetical protein
VRCEVFEAYAKATRRKGKEQRGSRADVGRGSTPHSLTP